jgi:hypothetical protein
VSPFVTIPLPGRRLELVSVVNEAKTEWAHTRAIGYLAGWDNAYRAFAGRDAWWLQFCECDEAFGDERPVSGGVWLDWKAEVAA